GISVAIAASDRTLLSAQGGRYGMDAIDLIHFQSRQAWAWLNMAVDDVTEE
ncbi:MAG: hypothetical protein IIC25_07420, partial [Chloroflexi bacterium]|nr:hypothetical protein [Chloroflexota bacterium]